jgi:uncharacterized membrane protein (DUF485 family)
MPSGYRRPRWRRRLTVLTVIVALLAVGGYVAYTAFQHYVTRLLTVPGCQAGTGNNAIPLDFGQASDAAIIAGVAVREHLPPQALTIAYATALQEAKLENPSYGTMDSVGIFQQRPSEGWGSTTQLEDPAYAATAFFGALVKVPGYTSIPVSQAAQDVQRSADGDAYQQYAQTGAALTADFTAAPHAVTCWYAPATQASSLGVSSNLNLKAASSGLADAFGAPGASGAVRAVTTARSGESGSFDVTADSGWAVANWLVANAGNYGITQVSYDGYQWTAGLTETGWQADRGAAARSIVAS